MRDKLISEIKSFMCGDLSVDDMTDGIVKGLIVNAKSTRIASENILQFIENRDTKSLVKLIDNTNISLEDIDNFDSILDCSGPVLLTSDYVPFFSMRADFPYGVIYGNGEYFSHIHNFIFTKSKHINSKARSQGTIVRFSQKLWIGRLDAPREGKLEFMSILLSPIVDMSNTTIRSYVEMYIDFTSSNTPDYLAFPETISVPERISFEIDDSFPYDIIKVNSSVGYWRIDYKEGLLYFNGVQFGFTKELCRIIVSSPAIHEIFIAMLTTLGLTNYRYSFSIVSYTKGTKEINYSESIVESIKTSITKERELMNLIGYDKKRIKRNELLNILDSREDTENIYNLLFR